MAARSTHSRILILDFGSQYTQVIARRIRECQVYSEIVPFDTPAAEVARLKPNGLVLSGGPASVYDKGAPHLNPEIFSLGIPVLGICYGMQLMAHHLGGEVEFSARREYGPGMLRITNSSQLFEGLGEQIDIWISHCRALAQSNRRPTYLYFREQWTVALARRRNRAACFRRKFSRAFEIRGCEQTLSRAAQRGDRSRNQTEAYRQ